MKRSTMGSAISELLLSMTPLPLISVQHDSRWQPQRVYGYKQQPKEIIRFKNFDIESGESAFSDHEFRSEKTEECFSNPTSSVSKKIAKEWRILEKNLPESIYVRAYERRLNLLRAVIVGPSGIPYHDGLFFFDILIPSDYPSVPPKVYYRAHGYYLNPNLYENGKVGLSLTNTWWGTGVERWTPTHSTILQVLVSIQGLVLNDRPYFNEPGYGLFKSTRLLVKKSLSYNEQAFIMSCKTLMHKLQKPPKGFEKFVIEHCRQRGESLLAAINAYSKGRAVVGHYSQECAPSSSVKVSSECQSSLQKIHMQLVDAFRKYHILPPEILEQAKLEDVKSFNLKGTAKEKGGKVDESKGEKPKKGLVGKIDDVFLKICVMCIIGSLLVVIVAFAGSKHIY